MNEDSALSFDDRMQLVSSLRETVCSRIIANNDEQYREQNAKVTVALSGYPDETLRALSAHFSATDDVSSTGVTALLVTEGQSAATVNECLEFLPKDMSNLVLGMSIDASLRSIHYYPQIPRMKDYSKAPLPLKEQLSALINVTLLLDDTFISEFPIAVSTSEDNVFYKFITDDDLVALILEYPQESDRIADIIIERRNWDTEFLRGILESSAPVLNEGVL